MIRVLGIRHCVLVLTLVVMCCGCVSERNIWPRLHPDRERDSDDAVGYVSISTPLFTPLDDPVTGDERLNFGSLRDEQKLAEALRTPAFGSKQLTLDLFRMALAARISGVAVDVKEVKESGSGALSGAAPNAPVDANGNPTTFQPTEGTQRREERTLTSPGEIGEQTLPGFDFTDTDTEHGKRLAKIMLDYLEPSKGTTYALPQDEVATLVASLKTYMVNLEQYYNVEGYNYARGLSGKYVPYKMHFTVTAEPGWYSRFRQYDAVCDVTCEMMGLPAELNSEDIIILSATPAEVGQTVTEFAAALNQFARAFDIEAPIQDVARVRGDFDHVVAMARQLEGMRTHKTMAIGFPASNRMRIRFMAQRAGTEQGQDLQPVSRLVTATVLIRQPALDSRKKGLGPDSHPFDARTLADASRTVLQALKLHESLARMNGDVYMALSRELSQLLETYDTEMKSAGSAGADEIARQAFRSSIEVLELASRYSPAQLQNIRTELSGLVDPAGPARTRVDEELVSNRVLGLTLRRLTDLLASYNLLSDEYSTRQFNFSDPEGLKEFNAALGDRMASLPADLALPRGDHLAEEDGDAPGGDDEAGVEIKKGKKRFLRDSGFRADPVWRVRYNLGQRLQRLFGEAMRIVESSTGRDSDLDALQHDLDQPSGPLGMVKGAVQKFLRGGTCQVHTRAFFSPTVRDENGEWSPPRELIFRVEPPADRLVSKEECPPCARFAPVPPWMGPLDQSLTLMGASGYYALDLACVDEAKLNLFKAEAKAKKATEKLGGLTDPKKHDSFAALQAAEIDIKKAKISLHAANLTLPARIKQDQAAIATLETQIRAEAASKAQATALIAELKARLAKLDAAKDKAAIVKLKAEIKAEEAKEAKAAGIITALTQTLGTARTALTAKLTKLTALRIALEDKEAALAALKKFNPDIEKHADEVDKAKGALKLAKIDLKAAKEKAAAAPGAVMGRGHAVVRFKYMAPPLLLDAKRTLIRHTGVYARVLGLRRANCVDASCGDAPCASDASACAPGHFCKLTSGTLQEFVLHVTDIDLSFAVVGEAKADEAKARPIRAYLQVVVVPDGMDPEEALTYPASQVRVEEILLESRVKASSGGATKPPAKKPEEDKIDVKLDNVSLKLVPKAAEKAEEKKDK